MKWMITAGEGLRFGLDWKATTEEQLDQIQSFAYAFPEKIRAEVQNQVPVRAVVSKYTHIEGLDPAIAGRLNKTRSVQERTQLSDWAKELATMMVRRATALSLDIGAPNACTSTSSSLGSCPTTITLTSFPFSTTGAIQSNTKRHVYECGPKSVK